jgi:hypothetical protein
MQHPKNVNPNPKRTTKDSQGKGRSNAAALRHWLECVSSRKYSAIFSASGSSRTIIRMAIIEAFNKQL